jgi:O-antigen/teichoic acid export membrane protein
MKRAVFLSLVDQALNSAFNLLLNLAFIAFATPDEFGRFAFLLAGSFFAASAQNALVVMPLNYLLPGREPREADAALSMLTSANLALVLMVMPASFGLAAVIGADMSLSLAAIAYFGTLMVREYVRNLMVVKGSVHLTLLYDAIAIVATVVFAVAFWQVLPPATATLAALSAGNCLSFICCRFDLKADFGRFSSHLSAYRGVWKDTRWALQGALQNEVMARSHVFLVERMRDAAALGMLNAGRVGVSPLLLVGTAWCRVARPRLVEKLARGEVASVLQLLRSGMVVIAGAAALYGLFLWVAWPYIDAYAFRDRYGDMAGNLVCWWLYALVVGQTSVMAALMEARRQFRALAIVGLGGAIIAPLLVFALLAAGLDASTAALGLAGVALMEFLVFGALTMRDLRSPAFGANRQGGVQ